MAEFMVVNPRHRRRRKARSARRTRVTRRRRRRTLTTRAANPRRIRRRRHAIARRRHGRRRHNPRIGGGQVVTILKHGAAIAGGAAISEIAGGFISKYLPANLQSGPTGLAVRGALGIVLLPALLRMTPLKRFAGSVALGSAAILLWDVYQQYVKPSLPLHGLGLGVYEPGSENLGVYGGQLVDGSAGVSGLGFGQDSMYADSMYT